MATTASGFWYPDGTEPYNIKALMASAAASQETTLATAKYRGGHFNYATTGARDTAYTAAGGPVVGDQCSVAGQPQWYDGTAWQTAWFVPAKGGLQRTATQTVTQGTWLAFDFSSAWLTAVNMTQGTTVGCTIILPGTYYINGNWIFNATITGTIPGLAGAFYKNGVAAGGSVIVARASAGTTSFTHSVVLELAASDIIRMAATPSGGSAGATANLTSASLSVVRIAG